MKILLLNGVNMNMLGKRNPAFYGSDTLKDLENKVKSYAKSKYGIKVITVQSNVEGVLVNILQRAKADGVILNAGAYSHYSYALRDCIECIDVPVIDVHMSNIYEREEDFRHTDVLKDVCAMQFCGKGLQSYLDAVDYLAIVKGAAAKGE